MKVIKEGLGDLGSASILNRGQMRGRRLHSPMNSWGCSVAKVSRARGCQRPNSDFGRKTGRITECSPNRYSAFPNASLNYARIFGRFERDPDFKAGYRNERRRVNDVKQTHGDEDDELMLFDRVAGEKWCSDGRVCT
jgi:hypothetical protein